MSFCMSLSYGSYEYTITLNSYCLVFNFVPHKNSVWLAKVTTSKIYMRWHKAGMPLEDDLLYVIVFSLNIYGFILDGLLLDNEYYGVLGFSLYWIDYWSYFTSSARDSLNISATFRALVYLFNWVLDDFLNSSNPFFSLSSNTIWWGKKGNSI